MVLSEDLEMPPDQDCVPEYTESTKGEFITVCKHGKSVDGSIVELCSKCEKVYDPSRPEKIPYYIKIKMVKAQIRCARADLGEIKKKIDENKVRIYGIEHPQGKPQEPQLSGSQDADGAVATRCDHKEELELMKQQL